MGLHGNLPDVKHNLHQFVLEEGESITELGGAMHVTQTQVTNKDGSINMANSTGKSHSAWQ